MADGIEEVPQQTNEQAIAEQMAFALGTGLPPQQSNQAPPDVLPSDAPPTDIPPIDNTPVFSFDTLKNEFQYEKPEDVVNEIKELRALKANPPKAEIKYENEESKQLHLALLAGKKSEVYRVLAEQERLETLTTLEVNKDTANDIIKLGMQIKYKDLSQDEINYKFNKQYAIPKPPVFNEDNETQEQYDSRLTDWKEQVADIEMTKIIDAKLAKPELEAAKKNIVMPQLESEAPDQDYLNYQTMMQEQAKLDAQTAEAYKTIAPKDVVTKFTFNDEASKVKFEFEYVPGEETFKKAVEIASDPQKFYGLFKNSDGSPNRQMFVDSVMYAMNKQEVLSNAIMQGSNARIKSQLPDNDSGGLVRQLPQDQQLSPLDQEMQRAGIKVG